MEKDKNKPCFHMSKGESNMKNPNYTKVAVTS